MRFRSLFLDYKAEALQIMREEKEEEEKLRNEQQDGDSETNAPTRKRVIRILVDPDEESDNVDEEEEETPSAESRQLPFWVSEAISKTKDESSYEKDTNANTMDTSLSKITRENSTIDSDDDDSMDLSGSDDSNMSRIQKEGDYNETVECTDGSVDKGKTLTIDYNSIYASPWLLNLVSFIRRRANRKRIANETVGHSFYIHSYDCHSCSIDSCSHWILRRAVDQHWIQNSWMAGWNRLEELLQIGCHRKMLDCQVRNRFPRKDKSLGASLSSWIRDGKGGFSSLSMHCTIPLQHTQHVQESNALVVYRGNSVDAGSQNIGGKDRNHQQLVLINKKESAQLFSSTKLWETAILTAAALCAYQQQQQQLKRTKEAISHQSTPKDPNDQEHRRKHKRKVIFLSPTSHSTSITKKSSKHGINEDNERKNKTSFVDQVRRCTIDFDQKCRKDIGNDRPQFKLRLLSPSSDNAVADPSEHSIGNTEKKRSPSPLQQEEEGEQILQKRPRKNEESSSELVDHSNTMLHHATVDCNSNRKYLNRKAEEIDKRTENALLFFRRFSKLSKTKRGNCDLSREVEKKSSVMADNNDASTYVQNEELKGREKCVAGTTGFNDDLADKNVDYSSPIEFPNCFDDNEEEEEFTGDIVTEFGAQREPDSFQAVNATDTTPQSSNMKKHGTEYYFCNKSIAQVKVKQEPGAFRDSSSTRLLPELSSKKKMKTRKRHKRTTEEKMLRKKEKRRRRESKKKNSTIQTESNDFEKESNELETPRKLDFREFPSREDSRKEECIRNPPNQRATCFHSPSLARTIRTGKCCSNDKDSEKSSPLKAKCIVPMRKDGMSTDDPFSISPEEILETFDCQTGQKEKQHRNIPRGKETANEKDQIGVLCSEAFIENFGEIITEIVRGNSNRNSIRFTDTGLIDVCSVDIETPSRGAILVSTLSQIQNSGGIMVSFLPRVIELAAINRYDELFVFVCVDMLMDSAAARDLVRLQTAFLACESGLPRTQTSVQLCSKRTLAAFISKTIIRSAENSLTNSSTKFDNWLSDSRTCQRLKFLLSIIPTLSVTGALHWLDLRVERSSCGSSKPNHKEDETADWFQRCFREAHVESRRLNKAMPKHLMNSSVPKQLLLVVNNRFNNV